MLHISQFYISNLAMKASCSRECEKTNFHPHYKEQYKYINNNFIDTENELMVTKGEMAEEVKGIN